MKYFFEMFQRFAQFTGRSTRKQFWIANFYYTVILILLLAISHIIGDTSLSLCYLFSIIGLIPTTALAVRRMHDAGYSGWYVLTFFVLIGLIFAAMPSKTETNSWGPMPGESIHFDFEKSNFA
ncbi:hypothetical protein COR50_08110 [Chitinophaga caeni]|uniref:DUF805 domain-containing protein n=1 Tax=Chitinophaga caeni TaxID=2029983 RepID=A0A291QT54_9BACT|nr:DUF805 domain-containing protein [Chitinophaga caeni]ATL47150.1 hypothetical protein COR50_08110 [Chitinophaga caeni]